MMDAKDIHALQTYLSTCRFDIEDIQHSFIYAYETLRWDETAVLINRMFLAFEKIKKPTERIAEIRIVKHAVYCRAANELSFVVFVRYTDNFIRSEDVTIDWKM